MTWNIFYNIEQYIIITEQKLGENVHLIIRKLRFELKTNLHGIGNIRKNKHKGFLHIAPPTIVSDINFLRREISESSR